MVLDRRLVGAAVLLLAVFASGVVLGTALTFMVRPPAVAPAFPGGAPPPGPPPPPVLAQRFRERLQLDEEQARQVLTIMERSRHEHDEAMASLKPRLDATLQRARADIRGLLRPEQLPLFDHLSAEMQRPPPPP